MEVDWVMEEGDRGGGGDSTSQSRARARSEDGRAPNAKWSLDEVREAGRRAAQVLREGGFQLEAAFAAGIHEKTYYRWLEGEDERCEAFRREVLPELFKQAHAAEERAEADIASAQGGSSAWASWHKWKLPQRYRKIFGDLATKHEVELSGNKDKDPIQSEGTVRYVIAVPPEETDE